MIWPFSMQLSKSLSGCRKIAFATRSTKCLRFSRRKKKLILNYLTKTIYQCLKSSARTPSCLSAWRRSSINKLMWESFKRSQEELELKTGDKLVIVGLVVVVVVLQVVGMLLMVRKQVQVVSKMMKKKLIPNGLSSILRSIEIGFTAM